MRACRVCISEFGPGFDSISPLKRIKQTNQDVMVIKRSESLSCLVKCILYVTLYIAARVFDISVQFITEAT